MSVRITNNSGAVAFSRHGDVVAESSPGRSRQGVSGLVVEFKGRGKPHDIAGALRALAGDIAAGTAPAAKAWTSGDSRFSMTVEVER